MTIVYRISPELRSKLKEPFGLLIQGSFDATMGKMERIVKKEKPPMIISIGDIVSRNLHEHQILPQLSITDNKHMRKRIQPRVFTGKNAVYVKNPKGTITNEAITAIREAMESYEHIHIIVDGEEDLLTIVAVLYAPENALVVYGQPFEGIVIVKVTRDKKANVMEILKAMKTVRKAK